MQNREERIELATKWFSFCDEAKRISSKATMKMIKKSMDKWHPDGISFSEEEILIGAEKAGFRYSKKPPYKFNIMTSTSQQFMEKEKWKKFENFAPYYFYFLPNKEKLLAIHEFIMFTLNKDSHRHINKRYKTVDNPEWNEEKHNYYWTNKSSKWYSSRDPKQYDFYVEGRNCVYKTTQEETGETYETVSLNYRYDLKIISDDPEKNNRLIIESTTNNGHNYNITLKSTSKDRDLIIDTTMTTPFTASSPVYVRFLEKLLEIEPDLDLCCEERILIDI